MKPDAMDSSFFMEMMSERGRMDRLQGQGPSGPEFGGADRRVANEERGFREVYDSVAKANTQSRRITALNTEVRDRRVNDWERTDAMPERLQVVDRPVPDGCVTSPEDSVEEAPLRGTPEAEEPTRIIREALEEVSAALNLTVDPGLKEISIYSVSQDTVRQFSEILYFLKQIAATLDNAAAQGQDLDLGSAVIDAAKSRGLSALIYQQAFRIEMGLSMLGIADQVAGDLAQKMAAPFSANIPQAVDPSLLSMPQAHLRKIFGEGAPDTSEGIAMLLRKIRELCSAYGPKEGNAPAIVRGLVAGSGAASNAGFLGFDAPVMRKILNIDGKQLVAGENAEAADRIAKLALPAGTAKLLAKNLAAGAVTPAEQLLQAGELSAKPSGAQFVLPLEGKLAGLAGRTFGESVMNQIAEKLHTALRSGTMEVRIQLRPESLGEVKLRIRVEGDIVFARIQVESQQVKHIVESSMQFLKDSLAQQHLQAGSLEVGVQGEGWAGSMDRQVDDAADGGDGNKVRTAADESDVEEAGRVMLGEETGRRFGNNTIEFFA